MAHIARELTVGILDVRSAHGALSCVNKIYFDRSYCLCGFQVFTFSIGFAFWYLSCIARSHTIFFVFMVAFFPGSFSSITTLSFANASICSLIALFLPSFTTFSALNLASSGTADIVCTC